MLKFIHAFLQRRKFAKVAKLFPVKTGCTRVFFYGSLKPGFRLWESYFGKYGTPDDATIVGEDSVAGLTLVSFGPYPGAITGLPTDIVRGFVVDIESGRAKGISRMEEGAGYTTITVRTERGLECLLYRYDHDTSKNKNVGSNWTLDHQNGKVLYRA